jgi:hypothetical protein
MYVFMCACVYELDPSPDCPLHACIVCVCVIVCLRVLEYNTHQHTRTHTQGHVQDSMLEESRSGGTAIGADTAGVQSRLDFFNTCGVCVCVCVSLSVSVSVWV